MLPRDFASSRVIVNLQVPTRSLAAATVRDNERNSRRARIARRTQFARASISTAGESRLQGKNNAAPSPSVPVIAGQERGRWRACCRRLAIAKIQDGKFVSREETRFARSATRFFPIRRDSAYRRFPPFRDFDGVCASSYYTPLVVYCDRIMRVHAMHRQSCESITRIIRHFGVAISIMRAEGVRRRRQCDPHSNTAM